MASGFIPLPPTCPMSDRFPDLVHAWPLRTTFGGLRRSTPTRARVSASSSPIVTRLPGEVVPYPPRNYVKFIYQFVQVLLAQRTQQMCTPFSVEFREN